MSVRVGINGFGRIGRLALRAAFRRPEFTIVHVNETQGGVETAAHLLEFDSIDGTQVKILAWYDNEWGYANRMVDLAAKVAASLEP